MESEDASYTRKGAYYSNIVFNKMINIIRNITYPKIESDQNKSPPTNHQKKTRYP